MNATKYVLTRFRTLSSLEGLGFAGTSGIEQLSQANCGISLHRCFGTGQAAVRPASHVQAQLITGHFLSSVRPSGHSIHSSCRVAMGKQHRVSLQQRAWSLIPRQTYRTRSTTEGMWQRDYYSSPYGRGRQSIWDGDTILYSLIGANCAGFFLWQSSPNLMRQQATVSINSIREGRIHTLLTSAFSHASLNHLFANMFTFYFFAKEVGYSFGGKKLLALYAAGAVAGSAAHVAFYWIKAQLASQVPWVREAHKAHAPPALGASAAVNAIVIFSILLAPQRTVLLYGVLPLPAALLGLLYIGGDMFGALGGHGGNVAYAGHLGGAATGVLAYLAVRQGRIRPRW